MKKYIFELIIEEGNDEWWEDILKENKSGCDEVKSLIADSLGDIGFYVGDNCSLKLTSFEED